jgi:lysophospholipase L1-like esterase
MNYSLGHQFGSGCINTLSPEAKAYKAAHGISNSAATKISNFFRGLADIGIRSNFLDGAILRADSQPTSGSSIPSLLGLSNLTMTGSPSRLRNGIYFNGSLQYATGNIVSSSGARTFVGLHCGTLDNTNTTNQPIFRFSNGTTTTNLAMNNNGSSFGQAVSFVSTLRTTSGNPGWSRNTTSIASVSLRDDAAVGASSFSMRRLNTVDGTAYTRTSTQGEASHTLNRLRMCLFANNGETSIFSSIERTIPAWFLFSKALSDSEENNLQTLIGQTILPKWRYVFEGDSIQASYIGGRYSDKGVWKGANLFATNLAVGGAGAVERAAAIGGNGLTTSNIANDMPTVVDIAAGTNDLGNYSAAARPVSTIHAALRTLWAFVRSTNPNALICASTVMQSSYITNQSRESDRIALNDLIKADEGIYYDVLFDKDAWTFEMTASRPVYTDATIFVQDGGGAAVHPTNTIGGGSDQLLAYMTAILETKPVIP